MKRTLAFVVLLVLACCAFQEPLFVYNKPAGGGGGVTWTLIQHPSNLTCTTPSCAVTVTAPTAGNLVIVAGAVFTGAGAAQTISSVTETGQTFTHCPSQYADQTTVGGIHMNADCYYVLSAAGSASTTITVVWSNAANQDVQVLEVHRSTGTAAIDTCGGGGATACASALVACTTCTGPTPTVSATDFVLAFNANEEDCTAVASPYNTSPSPNPDNANVFAIFAWSLSQSSGNAAVYTCTSGKAAASTFALK